MTASRFIQGLCITGIAFALVMWALLKRKTETASGQSEIPLVGRQTAPLYLDSQGILPLATLKDIAARRSEVSKLIVELRSGNSIRIRLAKEHMFGTPGTMIFEDTPEMRTRTFYSSVVLCALNSGGPTERRLADDLIQAIADTAAYDDQDLHMQMLSMLDMPLKVVKESMETMLSIPASELKNWWTNSFVRLRLLADEKTGPANSPPNKKPGT